MNIIRKIAFIAVAAIGLTAMAQESITQCECWIDGNIAERQVLTVESAEIDITPLHPGLHTFTMRVQRSDGVWSSSVTRFFLKLVEPTENTITHCRYWFDGNQSTAVVREVQNNRGTSIFGIVEIDVTNLEEGEHTISWMMRNSKQAWSQVTTETFTISASLRGDVNMDQLIDINDVTLLISLVLGSNVEEEYDAVAADCNVASGDGLVDINDVTALIHCVLTGNWE